MAEVAAAGEGTECALCMTCNVLPLCTNRSFCEVVCWLAAQAQCFERLLFSVSPRHCDSQLAGGAVLWAVASFECRGTQHFGACLGGGADLCCRRSALEHIALISWQAQRFGASHVEFCGKRSALAPGLTGAWCAWQAQDFGWSRAEFVRRNTLQGRALSVVTGAALGSTTCKSSDRGGRYAAG